MGLTFGSIEVKDFSGGITDNFINAPPNRAETLDNFILLNNKSLLLRPGSDIDDSVNDILPVGAQRIGALLNYNNSDALLVQTADRIYYRNPSAYTNLVGPTGNDAFSVGTTADYISHTQWNRHLFVTNDQFSSVQKIYRDGSNVLQIRTAGLPYLASNPTVTAGAAGARNYLYAFLYHYTYTVGTEIFEDFGPPVLVELNNSGDPSINPNSISLIPVLSNGATQNWDTTVIKVYIYRTEDAGDVLYKIGEVTNGITVFSDNVADSIAVDNEPIYTEGGVLENEPPPLCKYVHVVNNIGFYGHIKEGSEVFPNKYRQSVPFDIDSCPGQLEGQVEDEIAGISSVQSIPIILCKRHIYRIEGIYDETGQGFSNPVRISDTAGCVSALSIVQAENKIFWAGNDGFYVSDGYSCQKISFHLNESYASMLSEISDSRRIVGIYDEKKRTIKWALTSDSASLDNDTIFILDLYYGVSSESTFYSWSGGASFRPTSIVMFDGYLYRADTRGYVLKHDENLYTDAKIDTLVSASLWKRQTIIYNYRGPASNLNYANLRKWVTKFLITCRNRTNISIQPNAINDDGLVVRPLKEIRWRKNFVWGDPEFIWGSPECVWNAEGLIEALRWFPAKGLRCSYIQMQITNSYTIITNSDTLGDATVNNTLKTVTLNNAVAADWPVQSVDYYISFEEDDYTAQYLVTVRTDDTLTYSDSGNTSPNGTQKWVLKGYKKDECINLLSYCLKFAVTSDTEPTYTASEAGANE